MPVKKIVIDDENWELNTDDLKFSDATLNPFFEKVSGIIDYVGAGHARCIRWVASLEQKHKQKYIEKYKIYKEDGKSDKTADLYAEGDPEVCDLKQKYLDAKYIKDLIYAHLNALNSAREDAHNRGHMIRKEMSKLNSDINFPSEF